MDKKITFVGIIVLLVLVNGCISEQSGPYEIVNKVLNLEDEIDNLKLNQQLIENSGWQCIEYANKTTINPEWFDNCCVYIDVNLVGDKAEEYNLTVDNGTELTMELSIEDNTAYSASGFCVDGNEDFDSIGIDGQKVDMKTCAATPKMVETNETICVAKRLKGY